MVAVKAGDGGDCRVLNGLALLQPTRWARPDDACLGPSCLWLF